MRNNRDDDGAPIVRAGQGRDRSELIQTAILTVMLVIAGVLIFAGAMR